MTSPVMCLEVVLMATRNYVNPVIIDIRRHSVDIADTIPEFATVSEMKVRPKESKIYVEWEVAQ